MCGIAGKVSIRGRIDEELLLRMCDAVEHRGPDSRGTWSAGGVGLGVQRLAIIDLTTGEQPIFNEDRSIVVVLNGEIYNYRELRADLERSGHRFTTRTDTETIVHLYEELGDDCVQRLRGMFAFALWDQRRKRLLLARDRVGKKPLFYAESDGGLVFGSEPRVVLQDPEVERAMDPAAVDAFLQFAYVPDPASAFSALRKLPPAHVMTWEAGRTSLRRYWKLSYRSSSGGEDVGELEERIRETLLEATRLRLRSDVPVGAFLSGGVDSSAVVAAMMRVAGGTVSTFAIGFDDEAFDETAHARQVAELLGTDHHELRVNADALELLPRLVWHYGEPFADQSAIPSMRLAEVTRRHVTVALNGDGGDESFAGYSRYGSALQVHSMRWIPAPLAALGRAVFERVPAGDSPGGARLRLRKLFERLPMTPLQRHALVMAYFAEAERRALYTPDFLEAVSPATTAQVLERPWRDSDAETLLERLLDVDINTYLPGDLLVKMDIASMAHSLEVRSPLLDHELMELAASLPAATKHTRGQPKRILKDAVRPWLPGVDLDRPKMGFAVPLATWFRQGLRDLPADVLLDPASLARGYFRPDRVRTLITEHRALQADHADKLWALIQFELWLRTYIDPSTPTPVSLSVPAIVGA